MRSTQAAARWLLPLPGGPKIDRIEPAISGQVASTDVAAALESDTAKSAARCDASCRSGRRNCWMSEPRAVMN